MKNVTNYMNELNTYKNEEENTVYSNVDLELLYYNLNKYNNTKNITLLNYNDYIEKTGIQIINNIGANYENKNEEKLCIHNLDENKIYKIYGHPEKWMLDNNQVYSNCGVLALLNILHTYNKMTYSSKNEKNLTEEILNAGLCEDITNNGNTNYYESGKIDLADGGMNATQIKNFLEEYKNVSVEIKYNYNLNSIAEDVKSGKGVILGVDSSVLWNGKTSTTPKPHVINIIGIVYDENNTLVGFFVNDSGFYSSEKVHYYSKEIIEIAWDQQCPYDSDTNVKKMAIITSDKDENIKEWADDINATGNEYANIIRGNRGNNILKGENELGNTSNNPDKDNDVLIGNEGQDTLYGGIDDDVLIAGVAKKTNEEGEQEDLSNEELKGLINQKTNIVVENFESEKGIGSNLYGGKGNDLLIGDKGNDVLVAGEGEDYLYGGAGRDVLCNYANSSFLNGGYGNDRYDLKTGTTNTINDTDNKGTVHLNQYWVKGAEALFYLGSNVWHKDNITYTWNEDAEKLFIQKQGESEITTIEDYHYGALSIKLDKPKAEEIYADGQLQDPLVLDMNGDGIKTSISAYQGIYYDYNNDGFAEKMAWGVEGDGVLVADINNDGEIQGSSDILTGLTLTEYDTNQDGKINKQDENFNNLKIMDEDKNLYTLEEAGIAEIDISSYENVNYTDENGNRCTKLGSYTTTDGEELRFCFNPTKEILLAA